MSYKSIYEVKGPKMFLHLWISVSTLLAMICSVTSPGPGKYQKQDRFSKKAMLTRYSPRDPHRHKSQLCLDQSETRTRRLIDQQDRLTQSWYIWSRSAGCLLCLLFSVCCMAQCSILQFACLPLLSGEKNLWKGNLGCET